MHLYKLHLLRQVTSGIVKDALNAFHVAHQSSLETAPLSMQDMQL